MRARPSFGMTPTQAIRDLFAWRAPLYFSAKFMIDLGTQHVII